MISSEALKVEVRRRVRASQERVFQAFTRSDQLVQWFSPSPDVTMEVLELDLKEGGSYRLRYQYPDGKWDVVMGEYRRISHFDLLQFTWTWQPPDPHAGILTLVTIEFEVRGTETEVVVRHEGFPDSAIFQRHHVGWQGALEKLAALLHCNG